MQEGFYIYDPDASVWFDGHNWTNKLAAAKCFVHYSDAVCIANQFPPDIMILEIKAH